MPVEADFADTQAEPQSVKDWLDWLEIKLPFPVRRLTRGSLETESLRVRQSKKTGNLYTKHNVPAFMSRTGKKDGLMKRHCTGDFKIDVINKRLRELASGELKPWRKLHKAAISALCLWERQAKAARKAKTPAPLRPQWAWEECQNDALIVQWIGISVDEAHRMKDCRLPWVRNRWPLIEAGFSRAKCLQWMKDKGYPTPPRSSCVFCPYHSDSEWLRLKTHEPLEFKRAVLWEQQYQAALAKTSEIDGKPFLHRSCRPLSTVEFNASSQNALSLFGNECEGMCGV